jgi:hypothetical protein
MGSAVQKLGDFLQETRGALPDGGFASEQVAERVVTVAERAENLLTSVSHPQKPGMYVPLSKYNAAHYDEAVHVLPGHLVLVPPPLVGSSEKGFYPAVVSEDGIAAKALRLHVLRQPYLFKEGLRAGPAILLSAAGQSETIGVGDHGRGIGNGVEAEHYASLLATARNAGAAAAWRAGTHVNHEWREHSSVPTQFARLLLGQEAQQSTLTITREQITEGQAMILWHESLRDATGRPEAATRDGALVTLQALGYTALSPDAVDNVKRSLA